MALVTAKSFIIAFLPCWLAAFLFASVSHSQTILRELSLLNVNVPIADRVATTADDIIGLFPLYGSSIAASLFIALLATAFMTRKFQVRRYLVPVATATSVAVMLIAMRIILDFTFIASARYFPGFVLQCLAGLTGGLVFLAVFPILPRKN